jgi:protein-tyrosine phosphatase
MRPSAGEVRVPLTAGGAVSRLPDGGADSTPPPDPPFRILFVCTGNICRSAAAERLTRLHLENALGGGASRVQVASAGTRALVGAPVHPDTADVVRALGGDVERFTARQLHRTMLSEADLVLTMTTEHRTTALGLEPRALSRTFTLREAADLVALVVDAPAAVDRPAEDRPRSLAQRMAAARSRRDRGGVDDITDPINRPAEIHREVAEAVSACLRPVLQAVVADLRDRGALTLAAAPAQPAEVAPVAGPTSST